MAWLTVKDAAVAACVCERTMHGWMKAGHVEYRRSDTGMIRIKDEWIDRWIESWQSGKAEDELVEEIWGELK